MRPLGASELTHVGVIGLGAMGGAMAKRLLACGFAVHVFDVRTDAVAALVARGATGCRSPGAVARSSEIVCASLPSPAALEQAVFGADGVADSVAAGSVFIDLSTSDPDDVLRVAAELELRGAQMLDAPVGKGPDAAEAGELTLMVGGDEHVIERCRPVLDALGSRLFHCGALGGGATMKLANNLLSCGIAALVGEALVLGVAGGLEPRLMLDVMSETAADNWHLRHSAKDRILAGRFDPVFRLALAHKDLTLAAGFAAKRGVPLLVGAAARDLHQGALDLGLGEEDQVATVKVAERAAGVVVRHR